MRLKLYFRDEELGSAAVASDGSLAYVGSPGVRTRLDFYRRQSGLYGADLLRHVAGRLNGQTWCVLEEDATAAKSFDESKHPRDHGRFAEKPGAPGKPSKKPSRADELAAKIGSRRRGGTQSSSAFLLGLEAGDLTDADLRDVAMRFDLDSSGTAEQLKARLLGHALGGEAKEPEAAPSSLPAVGSIAERLAAYTHGDDVVKTLAASGDAYKEAQRLLREAMAADEEAGTAYGKVLNDLYAALGAGDEKTAGRLHRQSKPLKKAADAARKAYEQAIGPVAKANAEQRRVVLETLKATAPLSIPASKDKGLPDHQSRRTDDGIAWVQSVTEAAANLPPVRHEPVKGTGGQSVGFDRAHYMERRHGEIADVIRTDEWDSVDTVVHEYGHYLENNLPGVRKLAREYLNHRVGNEPLTKLKEKFPDAGYKDHEEGRKDKFDGYFGERSAYYVGKVYANDTEVISMGLQALYKDPARFAALEPEYCKLIVGVLHGHLRG